VRKYGTNMFLKKLHYSNDLNFCQYLKKKFNPRVNTTFHNKNILNILVAFEGFIVHSIFRRGFPLVTPSKYGISFFLFLCGKVCEKFPKKLVNFT